MDFRPIRSESFVDEAGNGAADEFVGIEVVRA